MKKEYIEYAIKLQPIGDSIIEISNSIGSNEEETLEKSVSKYRAASLELRNVQPPEVIKDLHNNLNVALEVWIGTVKNMATLKTEEEAKEQIQAQKKAEHTIENIINKIVETLKNN